MPDPKTLHHASDHRAHRAEAYAPTGDQLDVIAKAIEAILAGKPVPPEVRDWLAARAAVKARFRKP